jgi:sulfite exporter TauE/SafE
MHHHHHAEILDVSGGLAGLALALFLTGLAGSFTHCVGMCGPFVIAQVGAGLERMADGAAGYGTLRRLRGAALIPYHLGRMTTYAALGGAAGSLIGIAVGGAAYRVLAALLLAVAAMAMLAQAIGRGAGLLDRLLAGILPRQAPAVARQLLADPAGWRGYALGLVLGFLPCGLLYAALAAAAAAGDAARGALAMAAFAAGTIPGLAGVGWAGAVFGRRWKALAGILAPLALLASAALLLATALRLVA